MTELICPYCWQRATPRELRLRCPEECKRDGVFFASTAKQSRCPHGKEPSTARFCPHCDNRLEYDYITTRSQIVAMIGSRQAGKSTYVGVLIHELRNRVGEAFHGMSAELVGDSSRTRYRQVFAGPMYGQGKLVPVTDSLRAAHRLDPLLFMLRFPQPRSRIIKAPLLPGRRARDRLTATMMIFYDTSGEDILKDEGVDRLGRYLGAADGIIFLLDPLQISTVRRAVGDATPIPKDAPDQVEMIMRLTESLRARRQLVATQKISTPLAVAVAKTDALNGVLPTESVLRQRGPHEGVYDETDGQHVHDETRATISSWTDGDSLLNTVHNNFSTYRFFGISALGSPPVNETEISPSGIHPLRVEDPLLWLLAQFGHIRARKARR